MAKKKQVKEQTLEQKLWAAADQLRGNLSAADYKSVVLGLVFLKYLNDAFDVQYQVLVEEGLDLEEEPDAYIAENIFYVPKEARWNKISEAALSPEIGAVIDNALTAIEKYNDRLRGVLPTNYSRPELDKTRLGNVVDIFNNVEFRDNARDDLGRVYEYFLGQFASNEGKKGGEYYTPSCIVQMIVEVIQPYKGKIYDPACGSGGMFVQSEKFLERHQGSIDNVSVYGQEFNTDTWKLAQMNMAIHGLEAHFGEKAADTFFEDQHPTLRADFVMANPPFNISEWGGEKLVDDKRWQYGIPPKGNANFAWMQHMIYHLSDRGRIGLVLANGSLSAGGQEGEIRKNIIEAGLVEGIVALPAQLFYNVQIPCCVWFLASPQPSPQERETDRKVLFVDARNMGEMFDRTHRKLTDADIKKIADTFDAHRNGTLEAELGFCAAVSIDEVAKQDYVLTPGRYVGVAEAEDDGEPFAEKAARLTSELKELFAQSREQEEEIRKQLASIGLEV